jgi:prepilin-type N-terminal cleavage/methylation domain-containing protein
MTMTTNRQAWSGRSGFTLIELIVVLSIILFLATIAALLLPQILERERASQGASQVQGWLMIARGRAIRDQAPRGIRLNLNTDPASAATNVVNLQYIEQPEDLGGANGWPITAINSAAGSASVDFTAADFTNNDPLGVGGTSDNWLVRAGDYLEIKGGGTMYQITGVANIAGQANGPGNRLVLASTPVAVTTPTWQYRIIRQPRVLAGEDTLQLPQDVAVDLTLSLGCNGATRTALSTFSNSVDILFDRFGNVTGPAAMFDRMILWVRDTTLDVDNGDQTLIAIGCRSGNIEAHAVNFDSSLGDFYIFTQDGRSTGT